MASDYRISYWKKGLGLQNFGDFLSEFLFSALSSRTWLDRQAGRLRGNYDVIHLLGSVISDSHIERDLEHARAGGGTSIAFWGCGMRDNVPIRSDLLPHCVFLGARGPLTRDLLGLPKDTPLGDPCLMIPLIHRAKRSALTAGRVICVPHFLEKGTDVELLTRSGADLIIRANITPDFAVLRKLIDAIVGARLVLAGALHAAIVACAFGTPFVFFDGGYVDVPFKWEDFAASVNIPCTFAKSAEEGGDIYEHEIRPNCQRPDIAFLLGCAPIAAPRRLLRKARTFGLPPLANFV